MPLSVIISAFNEAEVIERALKSVKFADEVIVVDLESTDETAKIAKKYTDKIFTHKNLGYIEPVRNFSIQKASHEWILLLDADEEVSPGLRQAIQGIISAKDQSELPDCFYLPRKNIIFDQWIKTGNWWPDYQLRFFRKGHIEWSDKIHSVPITTGEVKEFPAQEKLAITHHNYQTIEQYIERFNRYSTIQAKEHQSDRTITSAEVLDEFFERLNARLFAYKGIDDGVHGVSLSLLQATSDAAVKMKAWQAQGFKEADKQWPQVRAAIRKFQRETNYWVAATEIRKSNPLTHWWWRLRRKLMV